MGGHRTSKERGLQDSLQRVLATLDDDALR
jgi:hypothetical protein